MVWIVLDYAVVHVLIEFLLSMNTHLSRVFHAPRFDAACIPFEKIPHGLNTDKKFLRT